RALLGQPRRGRPVPTPRRAASAVRGCRRARGRRHRRVLRLRCDRLSRPARARTRRPRAGAALLGLLVAVERRSVAPGGHRRRMTAATTPAGYVPLSAPSAPGRLATLATPQGTCGADARPTA